MNLASAIPFAMSGLPLSYYMVNETLGEVEMIVQLHGSKIKRVAADLHLSKTKSAHVPTTEILFFNVNEGSTERQS